MNEDRGSILVVYVEPGMYARETEIGLELKDLQNAVRRPMEVFYPFDEAVCIVCNEEGKINGMKLNRAVFGDDGKIMDVIAGPFFICGSGEEDFISLTDDQMDRYLGLFKRPERIQIMGGNMVVTLYDPVKESVQER